MKITRRALSILAAALPLAFAITAVAGPGDRLDRRPILACASCGETDIEPDVASDAAGNFVLVWRRAYVDEIRGRRFAADGTPRGGEFVVAPSTAGLIGEPAVAMAGDGRFVVTWLVRAGFKGTVYARRYGADGTALGSVLTVNSSDRLPGLPDVAMADSGEFVIVFSDSNVSGAASMAWARMYDANGTAALGEFLLDGSNSDYPTGGPRVALSEQRIFVVVWPRAEAQGGDVVLRGRRYSLAGYAIGFTFDVATSTAGSLVSPDFAVAADDRGGFVVAYSRWRNTASGWEVLGTFARLYNALAQPRGEAFRVAAPGITVGSEIEIGTDMDADGDFVVAWNDREPNFGPNNLHVRVYGADGTAITGDRKYLFGQAGPRETEVAMADDGDFVVAWQRSPRFEEGPYAQRFAGPDDRRASCAGYVATRVGTSGADTMHGTTGDDIITGLGGNDLLYGGGGDDVLCGAAGDDQLFGEADRDLLSGGLGDDVLDGGSERDVCVGNGQLTADVAQACETVRSVP
jgi:RTX toxins and related Ca2+-binding proteins